MTDLMHTLMLALTLAATDGGSASALDAGALQSLPQGEHLVFVSLVQDPQGSTVALMLRLLDDDAPLKGVLVQTVDGRGRRDSHWFPGATFTPMSYPGAPALALAYRLEGETWTLVEAEPTTAEACDALGVLALEASQWLPGGRQFH